MVARSSDIAAPAPSSISRAAGSHWCSEAAPILAFPLLAPRFFSSGNAAASAIQPHIDGHQAIHDQVQPLLFLKIGANKLHLHVFELLRQLLTRSSGS